MSNRGPFGLWMGMTESDFDDPLEELSQCKFKACSVPESHSAFDLFIVQITPKNGLSWIKAVGKTVDSSAYGIELKSTFESMESKLASTYGKHKKHDFLMADSIWNEPRDWMQGIVSRERVLMAVWSRKDGSSLSNSLVSVGLFANVCDTSSGYIAIEYTFENGAKADVEIASLEDCAL